MTRWRNTGIARESGQAYLRQVQRADREGLFAKKELKNPKRRDRFVREVRTMQELHAEGLAVPAVVDIDLDANRPWFVMPWCDGGSLEAAVLDQRYVGDTAGGLARLQELGTILACVHARDLAHRDLKPANVLVDGGALLLSDFGLCLGLDDEEERLTASGEAVGSRHFIAPENEGGINEELDQRPADMYAFGKVVWVLLAGRWPPAREALIEQPHRLSSLLDDRRLTPLDLLIRDLVQRDLRLRPTDWAAVLGDLHVVEERLRGRAAPQPPAAPSLEDLARRVATAPRIEAEARRREDRADRDAWFSRLMVQMTQRAQLTNRRLDDANRGANGALKMLVSLGEPPDERLLKSGDVDVPDGRRLGLAPREQAIVFGLDSPQRLASLPAYALRVWVVANGDRIWICRVPTFRRRLPPSEAICRHLMDHFFATWGPWPAHREATVERACAVADETGAAFLRLCEHYLLLAGRDENLADSASWSAFTL